MKVWSRKIIFRWHNSSRTAIRFHSSISASVHRETVAGLSLWSGICASLSVLLTVLSWYPVQDFDKVIILSHSSSAVIHFANLYPSRSRLRSNIFVLTDPCFLNTVWLRILDQQTCFYHSLFWMTTLLAICNHFCSCRQPTNMAGVTV